MAYDNTNTGAIWKNDDKDSDKHPDFKGQANINGQEFWVSAWKRSPDANPKAPALKFSFKLKESQAPQAKAAINKPGEDFVEDSEIPF